MKKTIILFFVAIAMISCNTSKQAVTAEMLNGEWKIISVNGQTVKKPMRTRPLHSSTSTCRRTGYRVQQDAIG